MKEYKISIQDTGAHLTSIILQSPYTKDEQQIMLRVDCTGDKLKDMNDILQAITFQIAEVEK